MGKSAHLRIGKIDMSSIVKEARGQGGVGGLPSAQPALPCVLGPGSLTDRQAVPWAELPLLMRPEADFSGPLLCCLPGRSWRQGRSTHQESCYTGVLGLLRCGWEEASARG